MKSFVRYATQRGSTRLRLRRQSAADATNHLERAASAINALAAVTKKRSNCLMNAPLWGVDMRAHTHTQTCIEMSQVAVATQQVSAEALITRAATIECVESQRAHIHIHIDFQCLCICMCVRTQMCLSIKQIPATAGRCIYARIFSSWRLILCGNTYLGVCVHI